MTSDQDTIDVDLRELTNPPPSQNGGVYTSTSKLQIIARPPEFAKSGTANWLSPFAITSERESLRSLKDEWKRQAHEVPIFEGYSSSKQLLIIDLHDFEIYRSPHFGHNGRWHDFISLHLLESPTPKKLCVDGFLCVGNLRHRVEGVEIKDLSVEGYGDRTDPGVKCYLQSQNAADDDTYDIWFRLNQPSLPYRRFHEPFIWIAQLAKHVIDFLQEQSSRAIRLEDFRKWFYLWTSCRHGQHTVFKLWHSAFNHEKDFRVCVNAYIDYIYLQAFNLVDSKQLLRHPLWSECMVRGMRCVELQPMVEKFTVTTPDVYQLFRQMYFGANLRSNCPSQLVRAKQEDRKRSLGFAMTLASKSTTSLSTTICRPYDAAYVRVGDVVAIDPDEHDKHVWKNANAEWLAYIQDIIPQTDGGQRLLVLWLYRPRDTNIFKARYPFDNELFMSDNCNCGEGELLSEHIKGKYDVAWSPSFIPADKLFIRQTYLTQESAFVSFTDQHKTCSCKQKKAQVSQTYQRGDTVYVTRTLKGQKILDPTIVWSTDEYMGTVTVRKLLRLKRDCAEIALASRGQDLAPNEVVLTSDYEVLKISRLQRTCSILFVTEDNIRDNQIPAPYNRDGAGDFWYFSMEIEKHDTSNLVFLSRTPSWHRTAPFMASQALKLRGLSLFSGGGSLDRGLEAGGSVKFRSVVDISSSAIHTQRANAKSPGSIRFYCGSVDDFLNAALLDRESKLVARIGEVDFLVAGSPCPGFSVLQQNFMSPSSLRNASHITTFCSFVDHYRPRYGILENVVNMASTRTGHEDENVLSQVVACLVSLGYQVNQFIMDAWSYGSKQQRSRVILTIAAPGLTPLVQPPHTHNLPHESTVGRSLGKLPNGQRFGEREYYPTPFPHVPAKALDKGLPAIGNGVIQTCIPFPDHRLAYLPSSKERALIARIPRYPAECGYKEAMQYGLIPKLLQKNKRELGKAYRRIHAEGLVPTITTAISLQDARNGATLHWSEHRSISILEARRAQGYADTEPIIGTLAEQYEIVGNGVDRSVSFALGIALRKALHDNVTRGYKQPFPTSGLAHMDATVPLIDMNENSQAMDDDAFGRLVESRKSISVVIPQRPKTETSRGIPKGTVSDIFTAKAASHKHVLNGLGSANHGYENAQATLSHSRPAKTPANCVGRLSMSSTTTYTLGLSTSSVPKKRHWEEEGVKLQTSPTKIDSVRKKTKQCDSAQDSSSRERGTQSSEVTTESSRLRYTRHSGLEVEFVPRHWNKRPERERGGDVSSSLKNRALDFSSAVHNHDYRLDNVYGLNHKLETRWDQIFHKPTDTHGPSLISTPPNHLSSHTQTLPHPTS
ncbi:hypothetical protein ACN47E_003686 [Coniothyrium glycines]